MTRVLVVWEDRYFEALGVLVERAVHAGADPAAATRPTVVNHTSRGSGGFAHYVQETWPRAHQRGVPLDPRPLDHVICVVDADRLHELKIVAQPPRDVNTMEVWHQEAERAWRGWLHSRCDPGGPPATTVHGFVLRWSRESALLAGFDQPAWPESLGVTIDAPAVQAKLRADCKPHPSEVSDASFTNTFRRPLSCLQFVRQANKLSQIDKNDPAIDDALKALARRSLPTLLARMPDLASLATSIWSLHRGVPAPAPPTTLAPPKPSKPANKPRRTKGAAPSKRKRS